MNKLIEGNKIINVIDDNDDINYELKDNSSLVLNIFNHCLDNHSINITGSNNTELVINYAGISSKDVDININTDINGNNNRVIINGRFISLSNECNVKVDTYVIKNTVDNYVDENIKGINEEGKVLVEPILRIDTNEVNASHSASVGKYDKNILFYLKSKGLEESVVKELIKHSFLYSLFSDNFIQMVDKKRGENE